MAKYWSIFVIWAFCVVAWTLYPYRFVSDDPLFNLVIARNLALHGQHSFSGVYPTNGFHPLWQYMMAGYTYICVLIDPALIHRIGFAVPLAAAMALWGGLCFARFAEIAKLPRFLVADLTLMVVMALGVLYYESHLCYAMLGWLAWATVARPMDTPRRAIYLGLIAGLVFLSRLDTMFMIGLYGLWYLWRVRRWSSVACFAGTVCALAVPYVASNVIFFGSAMPISGWIKSSFPHLYLRGLENPMAGPSLSLSLFGCSIVFGLLPVAVASLAWLYARGMSAEIRGLIGVFLGGAILQLLYIALFTRTETWWYNYYTLSIVVGGLGAGLGVGKWLAQRGWPERAAPWQRRAAALVTPVLVVLFIVGTAARRLHSSGLIEMQTALETYLAEHHASRSTIMIGDFPGRLAFATDNYIVATDMLTGNRRLYDAMMNSPQPIQYLLDYCAGRGHPVDYVVKIGKPYITAGEDRQTAVVNDPKQYPRLVPLGKVRAPVPYDEPYPGLLIYRLRPDR